MPVQFYPGSVIKFNCDNKFLGFSEKKSIFNFGVKLKVVETILDDSFEIELSFEDFRKI